MTAVETDAGGRDKQWSSIDACLSDVVVRLLGGEQLLDLKWRERPSPCLLIATIQLDNAAWTEHFSFDLQQRRGAWHLPPRTDVPVGWIQFSWVAKRWPLYPLQAAAGQTVRLELSGEPWAVCAWAALAPLMTEVWAPIERWIALAGSLTNEQADEHWAADTLLYDELGIGGSALEALLVSHADAGSEIVEVEEAIKQVVAAVSAAGPSLWRRWSERSLAALTARHQDLADRTGGVTQRKFVTGKGGRLAAQQLSALFGGDWLAFLQCAGVQPHPKDQVVTGASKPTLRVPRREAERAKAVGQGLDPAALRQITASLWRGDEAYPIDERLDTLRTYWPHAYANEPQGHEMGGAMPGVSADLEARIRRFWGTTMSYRTPTQIVTNFEPFATARDALGPALDTWQCLVRTVSLAGNGRYGDHSGLEHGLIHYAAPLQKAQLALAGGEVGFDVERIIADLRSLDSSEAEPGALSHEMRARLDQHELAWRTDHLDRYLEERWERDLAAVSQRHHKLWAQRGRPPTPKQLGAPARKAAVFWFGGDVRDVYSAIGEPLPAKAKIEDRVLVPHLTASDLIEAARATLVQMVPTLRPESAALRLLASRAVNYVFQREELGRPLEPDELVSWPEEFARAMADDGHEGREDYIAAIETAIRRLAEAASSRAA